MSQYHKINIGCGHIVRDVTIPPFKKKFRFGTMELKNDISNDLKENRNVPYLEYVNSRIHYFVDKAILDLADEEIHKYVQKNMWFIRNDMKIIE